MEDGLVLARQSVCICVETEKFQSLRFVIVEKMTGRVMAAQMIA